MVREERFITDQEAQEFNFKAGQGSQTGGEGLLGFPCVGIQEQEMKAEGFRDRAAKEFCMDWLSSRIRTPCCSFRNSCSNQLHCA